MTGKIIRIISNLYTVSANNIEYECRARGKFRNDELTPLVGDIVIFDAEQNYILEIKERKNCLERPTIANVDSCIIVSSCKRPDFSALLLDKMITNVMLKDVRPIICFSKYDLMTEEEQLEFNKIIEYYNSIGIPTFINSQIESLMETIKDEIVVLTGQTGVGKSTLLNKINPEFNLATNDISEALGRGKHTTRHVELFEVGSSLIADTPGFSALDVNKDEMLNIRFTFPEFENDECKFSDCKHLCEKGCRVLEQVSEGSILPSRYESYKRMMTE